MFVGLGWFVFFSFCKTSFALGFGSGEVRVKCHCSLMKSLSLQDRAPASSCPTEKFREGGVRTRRGLHAAKEHRTRSQHNTLYLRTGQSSPQGDRPLCGPYATWKFHPVQDLARTPHPPHPSPPDRDSAQRYANCLAGARGRVFIYRCSAERIYLQVQCTLRRNSSASTKTPKTEKTKLPLSNPSQK